MWLLYLAYQHTHTRAPWYMSSGEFRSANKQANAEPNRNLRVTNITRTGQKASEECEHKSAHQKYQHRPKKHGKCTCQKIDERSLGSKLKFYRLQKLLQTANPRCGPFHFCYLLFHCTTMDPFRAAINVQNVTQTYINIFTTLLSVFTFILVWLQNIQKLKKTPNCSVWQILGKIVFFFSYLDLNLKSNGPLLFVAQNVMAFVVILVMIQNSVNKNVAEKSHWKRKLQRNKMPPLTSKNTFVRLADNR